jgi:hypothetical protein
LISNNQTPKESPSTPTATTATAINVGAASSQDAATKQNATVITEEATEQEQEEHVSDPWLETNQILQGMLQARLFPLLFKEESLIQSCLAKMLSRKSLSFPTFC